MIARVGLLHAKVLQQHSCSLHTQAFMYVYYYIDNYYTDYYHTSQACREGGGSFPGPHDVWGAPPSLKNTENGVPGSSFLT